MSADLRCPAAGSFALPFYYGWVSVALAALAMVGTLPGRTQGLGLITETLIADLRIDRVAFARINLWATLAGPLFCLGVGRLIDRYGSRAVLAAVAAALGSVVLLMAGALVALPRVTAESHVRTYAAVMGLAGGFVIVTFFTYWSRAYGRAHLGKI